MRPSQLDKSFTLGSVARHPLRFAAALGLGTLWYVVIPSVAAAAVFTAILSDSTNTFSSGNLLLQATTPDTAVCLSSGAAISSDAAACSGNPMPSTTLSTTATSASTTLASTGTLGATQGLFSAGLCAVQQFTDASSSANDPVLPVSGVTFGSTMSQLSSTDASFNGTSGWGETVKSFANPENFSIAGWFNTSSAQGTLIGFSSVQTNAGSTSNDRELWIDSAGKLVWATTTSSTAKTEVTSPSAYNNGAWHYVVASIGTANHIQLYVDGSLVASSSAATAAYNYTGYWTLGWGSELSATPAWTDKPTNAYFNGQLSGFAVIPSQLTAAQVTTLYGAATQSAYSTDVTALSPSVYWPLSDTGSQGYTGALPGLSATTVKFADASGSANTGSPGTGTITTGAAGPLSGGAVTLAGTAGSAINAATGAASVQTTSQSIWFKTTSSGVLMSRNSSTADGGAPTDSDHILWIDSAGKLVYGLATGSTPTRVQVTSPSAYNDGTWHLAVVTVSASTISLYVDNALVATGTTSTVQSYTGYWHLGYGYTTGYSDVPTNTYFTGSLALAAVYPTTLTTTQVASLDTVSSVASEEIAALALSPTGLWPLNDQVTSPVCAKVDVTIGAVKGATTSCVEPYVAAAACAAPSTAVEANTVLPKAMPVPVSGTNVTISLTLLLNATLATGVTGLHLLLPLTFTSADSSFSAQDSYSFAQATL